MNTPTPASNPVRHRALGDHSWQNRAACQSTEHNPVDPEIFFPDPDEVDKIAAAKALCDQCPVRQTCLDVALEGNDVYGIRGGMTEEERRPLHDELADRLDRSRVDDAIAGRDIHLTKPERRAVVLEAYRRGISEERLAWLLKITEEHAQKLYRETRRALRNGELRRASATAPLAESSAADRHGRRDFGTAA
ncbi:WhiB family transcriptional regulator [Streptomyces sp. B6B3]|uniref:WhiB family transcriptional regulator n=1 Tax=Streptomyces sp. B6B3 TaxID=3153570 RepID=UPI00325EB97D